MKNDPRYKAWLSEVMCDEVHGSMSKM